MDSQTIYDHVRARYSAASHTTNARYGEAVAKSFGYSEDELAGAAEGSNLGLSCGNPLAIASIREGETVIDLGCGAGFDVFLAAGRVGGSGKVVGVDMNRDMLARANKIKADTGKTNVDFVSSYITDMSILASSTADCVISNCVINLVPEKEKELVFKEMFRLLKPGGRVALSDILAKKPLPDKLKSDISMYVGCIAGASMVGDYERYLRDAGFSATLITDTQRDLNVYLQTSEDGSTSSSCCVPVASDRAEKKSCCDRSQEKGGTARASSTCCEEDCCAPDNKVMNTPETDLNEWVGSFKIYAVKP